MSDLSIAGRYASALFIVTERRGETARALEDLKSLREAIPRGTPAAALLGSPLVPLADKRRVLEQVLSGRALHSVVLFVDLLLRKKRLREFEKIVHAFEAQVERQQGIREAEVVSAVPLTADELARLHRELERYTGAHIKLATAIDPALLGGALVRIGDHLIDRTVRTLLDSIQEQLSQVQV